MIALSVVAVWVAISIVGAKGLALFARAASSGLELDAQPGPGECGLPGAAADLARASRPGESS